MAKKQEEIAVVDEAVVDAAESRVYELGFHIDPELPTEEVKKTYAAVREMIGGRGTIIAEGEPQMIQLAYTISRQDTGGRRDFNSAYFSWIAYEATTGAHAEVTAYAGAQMRLVRFIDLVTTKEAARHSVEIREFETKAEAPAEEAEAVADVELEAALQSAAL